MKKLILFLFIGLQIQLSALAAPSSPFSDVEVIYSFRGIEGDKAVENPNQAQPKKYSSFYEPFNVSKLYHTKKIETMNHVSREFRGKELSIQVDSSKVTFGYDGVFFDVIPVSRMENGSGNKTEIVGQVYFSEQDSSNISDFAIINLESSKQGRIAMFIPIGKIIESLDSFAKTLPYFTKGEYKRTSAHHIFSTEQAKKAMIDYFGAKENTTYNKSYLEDYSNLRGQYMSILSLNNKVIWTRLPKGYVVNNFKNGYMLISKLKVVGSNGSSVIGGSSLMNDLSGGKWAGEGVTEVRRTSFSTVATASYIAKPYTSNLSRGFSYWPKYSLHNWYAATDRHYRGEYSCWSKLQGAFR